MPSLLGTGLLMVPSSGAWDLAMQEPTMGISILAMLVGTIVMGVALLRFQSGAEVPGAMLRAQQQQMDERRRLVVARRAHRRSRSA